MRLFVGTPAESASSTSTFCSGVDAGTGTSFAFRFSRLSFKSIGLNYCDLLVLVLLGMNMILLLFAEHGMESQLNIKQTKSNTVTII